jgi:hypothetical protein
MVITLRPAEAADATAIASIWHSGWRDGHLGHVPQELGVVRTKESFEARAADRIGDTTVALGGDEVAGHARAWLAVATGNARARRFYERSGWTDDGAFDYPAATEAGPIPVPCHRYVKDVG